MRNFHENDSAVAVSMTNGDGSAVLVGDC